jgi:hypothetical protein
MLASDLVRALPNRCLRDILQEIAARVGLSRPQATNTIRGRFGVSRSVVAVRTIAEHDPLRQSASLLFKAVVFYDTWRTVATAFNAP